MTMDIKRCVGGYMVVGSDGKPLSKRGLTRAQCIRRMKEVEQHRNFNAAKKNGPKEGEKK